jgi:hypothetical protein
MRDMTTWFCDAYASWQKGGNFRFVLYRVSINLISSSALHISLCDESAVTRVTGNYYICNGTVYCGATYSAAGRLPWLIAHRLCFKPLRQLRQLSPLSGVASFA